MFHYKVTVSCNKEIPGFEANPIDVMDEYKPNELKKFFKEKYVSLIKEYIEEDIEIAINALLEVKDKHIEKSIVLTSGAHDLAAVEEWNNSQIDLFVGSIRNQIMMHSSYDMEANL